ncbi:MAG: hypothetical protein ACQES5_03265 [Thermodesulfobacteriota bacterium]
MRSLLLSLMIVLFGGTSLAFFPEAKQIQQDLEENYGRLTSVQAEFVPGKADDLVWRVWQKGSLWRMEWVDSRENGLVFAAVGKGDTVRAVYPRDVKTGPAPTWILVQFADLIADRGFNPDTKEYAFLDDRPSIVFGYVGANNGVYRFWVDNENKVPLRLDHGSERYLQWWNFSSLGNYLLPRNMELHSGERNEKFRINWTGVNVDLPAELFSAAKFRARFKSSGQSKIPKVVRFSNEFFFALLPG